MCTLEDLKRPLGFVAFLLFVSLILMLTGAGVAFWQSCAWVNGAIDSCVYSAEVLKHNPLLTLVVLSTLASFLVLIALFQAACRLYGRGGMGLGWTLFVLQLLALLFAIVAIAYYYGDDDTISHDNGGVIYIFGIIALGVAVVVTFFDMGVVVICKK